MTSAPLQQQINYSLINSHAASNFCVITPQPTLINPQLSLITPPFLYPASRLSIKSIKSRSSITRKQQSTPFVSASSKSNSLQTSQTTSMSDNQNRDHRQMLHHFFSLHMILEVITFIWRLPGMIAGLLKKEEKLIDTIEDDINEAASAVQLGSRVVEGLAEGLEKVAEALDNKDLEKMADMVEEDAKKVDIIMDKVKARTKSVHDELEEVASSLGETMQGVEKVAAKRRVEVDAVTTTKERTESSTLREVPPPLTAPTNNIIGVHIEHHLLLENLMKLWQAKRVRIQCRAIVSSLQPFLANLNFEMPLIYSTSLKALIIVPFLMYLLAPLPPLLLSWSFN